MANDYVKTVQKGSTVYDIHDSRINDVSTLATQTDLAAKQDALVSGTNIKTINNESILGSGNITISGGGGDKLVPIEASLVPRTNVETIEMTSTWGSEGDFYQIAVTSHPSAYPDKVVVNYNNGESVEIPKTGAAPGGQAYIYGEMSQMGQPDFTNYPFCVGISTEQGFTSIIAPNNDATDVSIDAYIAADGEYDVQMPSGVTKTTILADIANGKVPVLHVSIPEGNDSFWCYSVEAVSGEVKFSGENDGTRVTIESDSNAWPMTLSTMPVPVSGTNDGTNWTTLTIDGTTKNIPAGGGGGGTDKVYPIPITATPAVSDTQLAAGQTLTMEDMPDAPPGYTYAVYTLSAGISFTEPYDAVVLEFGSGHQYLIPRLSLDSGMVIYGEDDGEGMPIFDNYPAAVMISLNNGAIEAVMLLSNVASGTEVYTSLQGKIYSETSFSLTANGITASDIDTAVAAGKVPIAVIDWSHKNYKSWCPATVRYTDNDHKPYYEFGGEYKGTQITIKNNANLWTLQWLTPYVEKIELTVDIDDANGKVYFRSLDNMRAMQAGMPMVTLKLYDYTSHEFSGYLGLTLSAQINNGAYTYYSSMQVAEDGSGTAYLTTLRVNSTDTLPGGSSIFMTQTSAPV